MASYLKYLHHKSLCWGCGERGDDFKSCSACLTAQYCGKECQTKNWLVHSGECVAYQATHPDNSPEDIAEWLEDVLDGASERGHITDEQMKRGEELIDILDPAGEEEDEGIGEPTILEKQEAINMAIHLSHSIHDLTHQDIIDVKNMNFHQDLHPEDLLEALQKKIKHGVEIMENIMDGSESSEDGDGHECESVESEYIGGDMTETEEQEEDDFNSEEAGYYSISKDEGSFLEWLQTESGDTEDEIWGKNEEGGDFEGEGDEIGSDFEEEDKPTLLALGHFETTLDKATAVANDLWGAIGELEKTGESINLSAIQKALDMLVHCSMAVEVTEGLELVGARRRRRRRRRRKGRKGKRRRRRKGRGRAEKRKARRAARKRRKAKTRGRSGNGKRTKKKRRPKTQRRMRRQQRKRRRREKRTKRKAERRRKKKEKKPRKKKSKKKEKKPKKRGRKKGREGKKARRRTKRKERKERRKRKRTERRTKRKRRKKERHKEKRGESKGRARGRDEGGGGGFERRGDDSSGGELNRERRRERAEESRARREEARLERETKREELRGRREEDTEERKRRREEQREMRQEEERDRRRRQKGEEESRQSRKADKDRIPKEERIQFYRDEIEKLEREPNKTNGDRKRIDEKKRMLKRLYGVDVGEYMIGTKFQFDDADLERFAYMDLLHQERLSCKLDILDFLKE